jgi:hypothetical protein
LSSNTTGIESCAFGLSSLGSATTGGYNTAYGRSSGTAITTGTYNTVIGHRTGDALTTGVGNTMVGADTGDRTTTGNYNVCIGYGTQTGGAGTDNSINIGHNFYVDGNVVGLGKDNNYIYANFATANTWTHNSDERLKKNVVTSTLGLNFINDLRPVTYNWKTSQEIDSSDAELVAAGRYHADKNLMDSDTTMHGFIAQEVKSALDTAGVANHGCWNRENNGIQGVSIEAMVIPLVKAVQELSAENEALSARITALES